MIDGPAPSADGAYPKGRVLCVTSNFPRWPGDSTTPFVLHLARDLQALGWRVDVLAPHGEQDTASQETMDGVRVERFSYLWPRRAQTVCYHGGALVNLRRAKSNLIKLPALVAAEWAAVARRLATRRYDVLHSHWILPQGFTGVLAARPLRIPHVLTVHGGDVFALKGGLLRRFKGFSLRHADAVTVNSSATEAAVREIEPHLSHLHRIPMGVEVRDVDKQDPKVRAIRERHRRGAGPLLVFVGRVVEEKGIGDLLHAVALLKGNLPDTTAVIAGEGQDRERFQAEAAALGVADRVTFTGWVQPEEVTAYLAAGDVFVGPSRTSPDGWVEAQGLTFIEAMVAGTPVIATRVGGIVDSVTDGVTGLTVDEASPEQIAAAVARLVGEPGLDDTLARNALESVAQRFSRPASAGAFDEVFGALTARRARGKAAH